MKTHINPELSLPYIGINVSRLPELVGLALDFGSGARAELRDRYVKRFDCSAHTAKEYVTSLVNLHVLEKIDRLACRLAHEPESYEHELLEGASHDNWDAFLEFLVSTNAVFEVFRTVVLGVMADCPNASHAEIRERTRDYLSVRGIQGSTTRRQTVEAFIRIFLRAVQGRDLQGVIAHELSPRMRTLVDSLTPAQSAFLASLLGAVARLRRELPLYRHLSVISLNDLLGFLSPGDKKNFVNQLLALREHGLVHLHATVPHAATALGMRTITQGNAVFSGFSLPSSLTNV
jgi:hypothetical protein